MKRFLVVRKFSKCFELFKGLVTQWLEYTPDKRGVSSSNLLEPMIISIFSKKIFVMIIDEYIVNDSALKHHLKRTLMTKYFEHIKLDNYAVKKRTTTKLVYLEKF